MEVVPPFQFQSGAYFLKVRIDDGTAMTEAELADVVIEEMMGITCNEFKQLWDNPKQRQSAKNRTKQMELTLWNAEGVLELVLAPNTPPKVPISLTYVDLSDAHDCF